MHSLIITFCLIICEFPKDVLLQLTLTTETSPQVIGEKVVLKCQFSGSGSCCDGTPRVWSKDNVVIMTDGQGSSTRYKEEIYSSSNYFSLTILKWEEGDVNKAFKCQYDFPTSSPLTLTNFIKRPTNACTVNNKKRDLNGNLQLTRISPSPTIFASYGDKNLTSDIAITTSAVYDTYYYDVSIASDLNGVLTCGNDETYTLGCVTGSVTTNICYKIDYCECGKCAGWDFMYSVIGTVIGTGVAVIFCVVKKIPGSKVIKIVGGTFGISNAVNVIVAVPIGLKACHCIDGTAPAFIVLGVGGSIITFVILKIILCKHQGVPKEKPGSSQWPPHKVDQEPKARPKVDSRPPPDTKHIKTENNMPLSENKPLPGIASHRPLPMPDLGKPQGGTKLKPLETDSMTEKKKKKKKKKKSEERDDE